MVPGPLEAEAWKPSGRGRPLHRPPDVEAPGLLVGHVLSHAPHDGVRLRGRHERHVAGRRRGEARPRRAGPGRRRVLLGEPGAPAQPEPDAEERQERDARQDRRREPGTLDGRLGHIEGWDPRPWGPDGAGVARTEGRRQARGHDAVRAQGRRHRTQDDDQDHDGDEAEDPHGREPPSARPRGESPPRAGRGGLFWYPRGRSLLGLPPEPPPRDAPHALGLVRRRGEQPREHVGQLRRAGGLVERQDGVVEQRGGNDARGQSLRRPSALVLQQVEHGYFSVMP